MEKGPPKAPAKIISFQGMRMPLGIEAACATDHGQRYALFINGKPEAWTEIEDTAKWWVEKLGYHHVATGVVRMVDRKPVSTNDMTALQVWQCYLALRDTGSPAMAQRFDDIYQDKITRGK